MELDAKDRKIFYLLTENSRMKRGDMAKRVGLKKNTVIYRINRLLKEKYIKRFVAITDFQRFGVYSYDLFVKIRALEKREQAIRAYFTKHPNVIWATTLFGQWDLFVQIAARSVEEFNELMGYITVFLGSNLENHEVKFPIKRTKMIHTMFDCEKETGYKYKLPSDSETMALDEADKKILRCLSSDGLASYMYIAKETGIAMETVRNRMNALRKKGVILKYAPEINYGKFNISTYLVIVNFRYMSVDSRKRVFGYLNHRNDVKIIFETVGKQEIYFYAAVGSPKELEALVKDMKYRFQNSILNAEHLLITEELKLDFFPEALAP